MASIPTRFVAATAGFGAVDGYLERQDATWAFRNPTLAAANPKNRSTDWMKKYSTYAEVGGVVVGALGLQRARSSQMSDLALGLLAASAAALGRKGGIYVAETQESPKPAVYSGTAQPPAGQAQVFAPYRGGAAPYYGGNPQTRGTERVLQMAV